MTLNVPVGEDILGLVLLGASDFDLLETPLWQVDVARSEIAVKLSVPKSECSRQSAKLGVIARRGVINDLDLPVILLVTNSDIAITGNFVVSFSNRCGDLVGVQVATRLSVEQPDNCLVTHKLDGIFWVELWLVTVGIEKPVVVRVFVVVASHLLLLRTFRICLNVRVKQAATISHVLQRCS